MQLHHSSRAAPPPVAIASALLLLLLLARPPLASAVDGVVEINQTRALAGAITASDTAGFPVTLDVR